MTFEQWCIKRKRIPLWASEPGEREAYNAGYEAGVEAVIKRLGDPEHLDINHLEDELRKLKRGDGSYRP